MPKRNPRPPVPGYATDAELIAATQEAAGLPAYTMARYVYDLNVSSYQQIVAGIRGASGPMRQFARVLLADPTQIGRIIDGLAPGVRERSARRAAAIARPAEIRDDLDAGLSTRTIAATHGVTTGQVARVARVAGYTPVGNGYWNTPTASATLPPQGG